MSESADFLSDLPPEARQASGVLRIDLAALRHNYRLLKEQVSARTLSAVVKADAYGLGAEKVVAALYQEGCRNFFVAHLEEAAPLLPQVPDDAAFYVLNGLHPGTEAEGSRTGRVVPVCNSLAQFEAWCAEANRLRRRFPTAIHVDTGMSRLGFSLDELEVLAAREDWRASLRVHLLISHLACADEPEHPLNPVQLQRFNQLVGRFPGASTSLANSAGCFLPESYHQQWARPGIALYGVNPLSLQTAPLAPVVSLHARVLQVRSVEAGASVGYGASYTADAPRRLATVAVGYADGWPRHLSNCGAVYWQSHRLPIVGRVSMDLTVVDISALPQDALQPGSWVELIGEHQTAAMIAADAGTIPYEILTRLGQRYYRHYTG